MLLSLFQFVSDSIDRMCRHFRECSCFCQQHRQSRECTCFGGPDVSSIDGVRVLHSAEHFAVLESALADVPDDGRPSLAPLQTGLVQLTAATDAGVKLVVILPVNGRHPQPGHLQHQHGTLRTRHIHVPDGLHAATHVESLVCLPAPPFHTLILPFHSYTLILTLLPLPRHSFTLNLTLLPLPRHSYTLNLTL